MKQKQFNNSESNFTFVKLGTFNTHMKRQSCFALGKNRITLFWSTVSIEPTTWIKINLNAVNAILYL